MMYRVYNVALSGKTHIEGIWSQGWAVVSRCTTIAVGSQFMGHGTADDIMKDFQKAHKDNIINNLV